MRMGSSPFARTVRQYLRILSFFLLTLHCMRIVWRSRLASDLLSVQVCCAFCRRENHRVLLKFASGAIFLLLVFLTLA